MPRFANFHWFQTQTLSPAARDAAREVLVVTRTFLPDPGGIQEYVYQRCLQETQRLVLLTSGYPSDRAFDQQQVFPIYRWPVLDLAPYLGRYLGFYWLVLQQVLNMLWEVVLGLKLYRQYQFRYIEWTHGYDFPAILLLSYLLPIRYFIYLHGDDLLCPLRNPGLRWLFQKTLNRATAIACNSAFTEALLRKHFSCSCPIYRVTPAVRPEKFGGPQLLQQLPRLRTQARRRYQIPESSVVILSVGRLVRRKGFNRVIEQLPALRQRGLEVYYLICGTGPMESELRQLAERLRVSEWVRFAGYPSDAELAALYATCDLFALLTFYDAHARSIEGFGIVYLEAGYFGKPVLANRIGGVGDAVQDGETGLLVPPNSPQSLAAALWLLCRNRSLRERLGQQGQHRATGMAPYHLLYQHKPPLPPVIVTACTS
jgi:glycosyltransferase involved in cell wall biosynthesis